MTIEEILTEHAADPRAAAKAADLMLSDSDLGGRHVMELDRLMADLEMAPNWADGFVSVLSDEALRNLVTGTGGDLGKASFEAAFNRPATEEHALAIAISTSQSDVIPARVLSMVVKASLARTPRDLISLVDVASKIARMRDDERIHLAAEPAAPLDRELLLGSGPALVKCIVGLLQDAASAYQHPDDHGRGKFASNASMLREVPGALRDATNSALDQLAAGPLRALVQRVRDYDIQQD